MNKIAILSLFLFFNAMDSFSQGVLITCVDTVTIRYRAENRMRDLQTRMNFITYSSTTKLDLDESYATAVKGQSRLFYNDSVIISNDIDPQYFLTGKWNENLYVKNYLNQLYSTYARNEEDENTIFFSNIRYTKLKKTTYYYMNAYFDCEFKSKYKPTGQSYPKFQRVAELRVEPTGKTGSGKNEWTVTVNSISFSKQGAYETDVQNEVTDITGAMDCDAKEVLTEFIKDEDELRKAKASKLAINADQSAGRGYYEDAKIYISRAISLDTANLAYKLKLSEYQKIIDKSLGDESKSKQWIQQADYAFKFRRYHVADSLYSQLSMLDSRYRIPEGEVRKKQMSPVIAKADGLQGLYSRNQFEQVISQCTMYLQSDNNTTPEYFYWRAKAYAATNNYKRALADLNQAVSIDENYLDAYEFRALLKLHNEDRSGALSDYSILKSKDPKNDFYFISSARAQREVGDYNKAVRDYESALQLNPENAITYFELGEVEFLTNENEIATKNFIRAIEKKKIYPEANYYLGQIAMKEAKSDRYLRAGNYFKLAISQGLSNELKNKIQQTADEFYNSVKDMSNPQNALAPLNCAIQIYDNKSDYYIARGNAYSKMGDLRKAIADYRTASTLENTDHMNHFLLGIAYYENEQLDSAKISFFKSLDIKDNFYPAKIYMGQTCYKEKEYAKSIGYFEDALKLKKDSARIYYYIGNAYSQLHQTQKALDYYAKALDRDEEDPDFNVGRGNVYFDLNEYKQAIKDYNHALGHNPELADALLHRAQCLIRMEDYDPALSDLNKYIQKRSVDPEALRLRGICLVKKSNYPMAIEDFKSSKKLDKAYVSEPVLNRYLAYSYLKINEPVHALDCISQLLQTDQNNPHGLLYKGVALSQQNKMADAMDFFKQAFQTGKFTRKDIRNETILAPVSKNADFSALVNQYLH
ncbi:MAG TPA: tetratricopeptide repeat protein [Bacteroidia bacterium]|nr:tetratricopeptide repeat protein [Bacteroidia bacterium]